MKIVIGDPKTTKSYQVELPKEKESLVYGLKIGDVFEGGLVGAGGYKFKITGGSDKEGFPMRADVGGTGRTKPILVDLPGFHAERKGERRKKTVRGGIVSEAISQLNVIVAEEGPTPLSELFGKKEEAGEAKEGEEKK